MPDLKPCFLGRSPINYLRRPRKYGSRPYKYIKKLASSFIGGDNMAKKKRRIKKHKKKQPRPTSNIRDKHHLCYQRKKWARGSLRVLRDYWYCKVSIPRDTLHKKLHLEISDIPVPSESSAKSALKQLEMLAEYNAISEYDSIERRLGILASLFDCSDQETADAFRKQLDIVREFRASSK